MDMAELAKFKRNSGQGQIVKIGNDDFYFKPLPLRNLPELMEFGRIINEQGETALMKKENATILFDILKVFVTNSYPELGKDVEVLDGFILNNMGTIQEVLMTTSVPKTEKGLTDKQKEAVERMKNAQSKTATE